jgi:PDZ domain-containing protein
VRRLLLVLLLVAMAAVVLRGQLPCDVLAAQPSCEVALLPGPTRDTLDIVAIDGEPTFDSAGQLRLTTVAVDSELGFLEWVRALFSPSTDIVGRDVIYPPGQTEDEVAEQNDLLMETSQLDATLAGLAAAGIDVDDLFRGAAIVEIADQAADGVDALEAGDVIVAVDGTEIRDARAAVELVSTRSPGDEVVLTLDDGTEVPLVATSHPDDPERALLGLVLQDEVDLPFDVDIDAGNIGGPSAGLMFALGIADLLGPEDITGGQVIAGTGTITVDGEVGPIGGIRQKIAGATSPRDDEDEPATAFLVPRGNLAEARTADVAAGVLLVPVDTIDDALAALEALADGEDPAGAIALGP